MGTSLIFWSYGRWEIWLLLFMRIDDRLHLDGTIDDVWGGCKFFGFVSVYILISDWSWTFVFSFGQIVALGWFRERLLALFTLLAAIELVPSSADFIADYFLLCEMFILSGLLFAFPRVWRVIVFGSLSKGEFEGLPLPIKFDLL